MREDRDLGQLGAFSRNRAPASFSALDRSNTGSAKNTPKSDMDLLACIQHLASLNWASHRMAARSPTRRAPRPGARPRMLVGISLSPLCCFLMCRRGAEMGSNIGGSLELITVASPLGRGTPRKRTARELIPAAHRYCCLSRNDMSAKKVMA